ncbi:MAG TPA: helix-turn-helix transcriptional regulator [Thermoanaerobaculia bacterium]|nr:helix-turn-helix transcriptional regulator [Thermoanaerobaculia bacterium]
MPEKVGARNDLAVALSLLRQLRGLEQEELAAASGVGFASIQKIEQGLRQLKAEAFRAIVAALGVDLATVEALVALIQKVRGGPAAATPAGSEGKAAAGGAGTERPAGREVAEVAAALETRPVAGGGAEGPAALAESRRRAPGLWARLARYPHAARQALVEEVAEFQDAGLCELLCEASVEAAVDDAQEAQGLAELAVLAGERVRGEEGWRRRVEGYARAHLTSALRVGGEQQGAAEAWAQAGALWAGRRRRRSGAAERGAGAGARGLPAAGPAGARGGAGAAQPRAGDRPLGRVAGAAARQVEGARGAGRLRRLDRDAAAGGGEDRRWARAAEAARRAP